MPILHHQEFARLGQIPLGFIGVLADILTVDGQEQISILSRLIRPSDGFQIRAFVGGILLASGSGGL